MPVAWSSVGTPPNPPAGDEPPRRAWYPAAPVPRTTPEPEPEPEPVDHRPGPAAAPAPATPPVVPTPEAAGEPTAPPAPDAPAPASGSHYVPPLVTPAVAGPPPAAPSPAPTPTPPAGPPPSGSVAPAPASPPTGRLDADPGALRPCHPERMHGARPDASAGWRPRAAPIPYRRRRWPWVVGAVVLAVAVTVGGVLYRDRRTGKAAPPLAAVQVELVRSPAVPSPLRSDCRGLAPLPAGVSVGLVCTPSDGASRVTFLRYPTADALTQAFDQRVPADVTRDSTDDCADVVDVEHPYATAQAMSGNVACFHQRGRSVIVWTMPSVTTLGIAQRDDRQDQVLYDWWNVSYRVKIDQGSDPSTFTDAQNALPPAHP